MAKKSAVEKNKRRQRMIANQAASRAALKATIKDKSVPFEERFAAVIKLSEKPRNSSRIRHRNRCELSGRPRAFYRKLHLSRIALRELASSGEIPGMIKSSW